MESAYENALEVDDGDVSEEEGEDSLEDYVPSSSSSESESDGEDSGYDNNDGGVTELTLVDEEPILIHQDLEEVGELGEGDYEDQDTGVSTRADEEEGEGDEDSKLDRLQVDKKETIVKKKKKKRKKWYSVCLTNCKYDVVRKVSKKFGFRDISDDEDWILYWTDYSVGLERVMDMKKYQKINHFPGMSEICRKDLLARNLNRMMKMFPKEYNVFPKTWCFPADHGDFQAYIRQKKNKTYILKPESGCQGKGIWVTKNTKDIKAHEHMICQVYLSRPLLIDGFKFDFRIYVLMTSCDPLRLYVFKDGLARFATNKYTEPTNNNIDNAYMHLTNYSINKHSNDFVRDDEAGSKRRISTINRYMQNKGYDVEKLWSDIDDVIIKTVISAHSVLKHNYRSCFPNHVKGSACFEILGVDILLDRKLRPYILEVNHSPSFNTDSALDREIKGALVWDTLHLVNFGACDKRKCIEEEKKRIKDRLLGKPNRKESKEELELAQAVYLESLEKYENNHMGNFRRIYPNPGFEKYEKFFHSSGTLFQETAAFKARSELARQQREEISRKQQKMECMLKGKRSLTGLRPESPGARRRQPLRRSVMPSRRLLSRAGQDQNYGHDSGRGINMEPIDTSKPVDILEEDELERISGLLQRDNLVRGLGIVEHVYRLLNCTPGTMGVMKGDPRPLPPPLQDSQRWLYNSRPLDACLAGRQPPIRVKDRQYYKKLLDRYFGNNHALANEHVKERTIHKSFAHTHYTTAQQGNTAYMRDDGNRHFPQVRLSYSTSERKMVLTHEGQGSSNAEAGNEEIIELETQHSEVSHRSSQNITLLDSRKTVHSACTTLSQHSSIGPRATVNLIPPPNPLINQTLFHSTSNLSTRLVPLSQLSAHLSTQPTHAHRLPSKSSSLSSLSSLNSLNKKTVPSYQRNKFTRKQLGVGRNIGSATDFQNLTLTDTEAEQNRIPARNGVNADWQSDTSAPTHGLKRTMSAQSRKKEGDVPWVASHQVTQDLSVVSAPAPRMQRPELIKPRLLSPHSSSFRRVTHHKGSADSYLRGQKLTRMQRIQGATSSVRLR